MNKKFMIYAINDYAEDYEEAIEMDKCRIAIVDILEQVIVEDFRNEGESLYFFKQGLFKGLEMAGIEFGIGKVLVTTEHWEAIEENIKKAQKVLEELSK